MASLPHLQLGFETQNIWTDEKNGKGNAKGINEGKRQQ